jgi:hypothetical protein
MAKVIGEGGSCSFHFLLSVAQLPNTNSSFRRTPRGVSRARFRRMASRNPEFCSGFPWISAFAGMLAVELHAVRDFCKSQ